MARTAYVFMLFPVMGRNVFTWYHSHMDWKTWKMRNLFPVREKSGNFEQTGKVREFHPKYWKKWGKFSQFIFSLTCLIEVYLVNRFFVFLKFIKGYTEKLLENGKKILEKSRKFVSPKMWEPCDTSQEVFNIAVPSGIRGIYHDVAQC